MTITNFKSALLVAREKEPAPAGFAATSETSMLISTGSKTFLTQANRAYKPGTRVRLISAADPTDYMEGDITAYTGSSMTVNVTRLGPTASGTHADWSIVVAGEPGSGDLLSSLNLSDVSDPDAARANIGAGDLLASNNLSDLTDVDEAKQNLGISQSPIFTPEQFGGGPGVADNSTAFQDLATAVRAAGGGTIELQASEVYTVYPSTMAAGFYTLFDFSNTKGVTFNSNGARITTPLNFTASGNVTVLAMSFQDSSDIIVNGFDLEQSVYNQKSEVAGFIGISMKNSVTNVVINNFHMNGGRAGVWVVRDNLLARANRAHGIVINNPTISKVAYPLSFQKNGDQVTITGARTNGADRCYFCYNVHQHDVQIESDANSALQDVVISNSYLSTEDQHSNTTSGIKLRYHCEPQPGWTAPNAYICLTFQSAATEGRNIMRNIDITFDINNQVTTEARPAIMVLNQTTTAQARLLENVRISGSYFVNAASVGSLMELFVDKSWAGDVVSNFKIEDLTVNSAGAVQTLFVDGRGIAGPFTLRYISGANGTNRAFSASNMGGAAAYLNYTQVYLPTLISP
jgi:hypothetical protein